VPPGLVLDSRERARSDETDHGRRASPIASCCRIPVCGVFRFNFAARESPRVPTAVLLLRSDGREQPMSGKSFEDRFRARIPVLVCLLVLCGMLLAGLLPFRGPRNGVTWLGNQNGVRLSGHSTLWSYGSFGVLDGGSGDSCSIEIWLQPGLPRDSSVILSFSTPENPLELTLHQYRSLLIVETRVPGGWHPASVIGTDGVFHQGTPVFVTISSGLQQTAMYVNGALARTFPGSRIGQDCRGRLVLATSPTMDESWRGQMRGLALYGAELTADQVRQHYETWTSGAVPALSDREDAVGLYLFNERSGDVVRNSIGGGINLEIPARYKLVHQLFLQPFWHEYKPTGSYGKDILINIVGFMPLGFLFYAYWSTVRPIRRAALVTTVLGFAVSLTIEVLQSQIPVRDSGTTDLITNTLGTFLGVQLYGWSPARTILARIYSARLS
jgi:VanZ family protein